MLPVLIVGAGPVGLFSAWLLSEQGIEFRMIDPSSEPSHTSKALAVHSRTLEMMASLGIVDHFVSQGNHLDGVCIYNQKAKRLVTAALSLGSDLPYPMTLALPQSETEGILIHLLEKKGIFVERGIRFSHCQESGDHLDVELLNAQEQVETLQVKYLLGCDGYHSQAREEMKVPYEGTDMALRFLMMDGQIQWPFDRSHIHVLYHHLGTCASFPMKNFDRIIIEVANDPTVPKDEEAMPEQIKHLMKDRWGVEIEISDVQWLSHFYVHERLAKHYRHNRVLLLGDAAHVHSPAGGQGMNTGLQDAYNLIWKLAFVIRGNTNSDLLDSYEQERRPVAKAVLASSTQLTKLAMLRSPLLCCLRDFFVKHVLKAKALQRKFVMQLSGVGIHYRNSSLVRHHVKAKYQSGDRAPTVLPGYQFTLLICERCSGKSAIQAWAEQLPLKIKVNVVPCGSALCKMYDLQNKFCLVRPDQYIAVYGDKQQELKVYFSEAVDYIELS